MNRPFIHSPPALLRRLLSFSERIDDGSASLSMRAALDKGSLGDYMRAAFDRCLSQAELAERYDATLPDGGHWLNGVNVTAACAIQDIDHACGCLIPSLLNQLRKTMTLSFPRNLILTSVLAQLVAMQDVCAIEVKSEKLLNEETLLNIPMLVTILDKVSDAQLHQIYHTHRLYRFLAILRNRHKMCLLLIFVLKWHALAHGSVTAH
jgi:hypothetical protein